MKTILVSLLALVSGSASAFECRVAPSEKVISVTRSGNYSHREGGYAYLLKYDASERYLVLMIEGGPMRLNVTNEAFGGQKSYLSLGAKGELSDIAIRCDN